jgi:ABC-type amino acid transport substrate-binding protein
MISMRHIMCVLTLTAIVAVGTAAANEEPPLARKLVVGTKEAPPFAMKSSEGVWTGISIDLWRQITSELNLTFEFRESDLKGILEGVANRSLDAGVAALTITPERENMLDFSHAFHSTGLAIAIAAKVGNCEGGKSLGRRSETFLFRGLSQSSRRSFPFVAGRGYVGVVV